MINIAIADDHMVFRSALIALLKAEPDFNILANVGKGAEVFDMVKQFQPDVLILDINMPDKSGIDVSKEILSHSHPVRILILTMYDNAVYAQSLHSLGVCGYMLKSSSPEKLFAAIRSVHLGEIVIDETIDLQLGRKTIDALQDKLILYKSLTPREEEICRLLVNGCTNSQIEKKLHISIRTVESHRKNAMAKLQLSNRAELVELIEQIDGLL
jgi:DNA-binding NarL/FixJ family response regulator